VFISQKTVFFIVTAVKTSHLRQLNRLGPIVENVSPVRYELGFHIQEDGILHTHRRGNLRSYVLLTAWAL
jgi:hypothetical protein